MQIPAPGAAIDEHGCFHEEDRQQGEGDPLMNAAAEEEQYNDEDTCGADEGFDPADLGTDTIVPDMPRRKLREIRKLSDEQKAKARRLTAGGDLMVQWKEVRRMSAAMNKVHKTRMLPTLEGLYRPVTADETSNGRVRMSREDREYLRTRRAPHQVSERAAHAMVDRSTREGQGRGRAARGKQREEARRAEPGR